MNGSVKQLWRDGLTSGEYVRGNGRLRDSSDRYCPLGVLCDLYLKQNPGKAEWVKFPGLGGYMFVNNEYDSSSAFLTHKVRQWAGLTSTAPLVLTGNGLVPIHILNDQGKYDYKELAELIDSL